tara:strand:- start:391 stop:612 length:222 start_codon:yes stop_codon:yes gene_type:complete
MLENIHIPHKELIERLKTIKEVLKENESAVTPDLLEAIDAIIKMMRPADKLMKDIDDIFDAMLGGGFYGNDKR